MPTSERSWRLSESYKNIVQNLTEGVVVEDAAGYLVFANPTAAHLLGYEPEELVGQHWTITVPPDQQLIVRAANTRRERGKTDRYQLELLHREGKRLPVLISSSPRFDAETGRFAGALVVFTDISEQVEAQKELSRRTDLLTALYQASQIFLGQIDSNTILESTCRLAVDRFGVEMAWVGMIAENGFGIRPVGVYGDREGYVDSIQVTWDESPTGHGPAGTAIRTRRAVVTNQIEVDPGFAPWREAATSRGYRSAAALPLLAGSRVLGALNVYSGDPGYFTDEQVQVLQSLANQAAIALENARLYEEAQYHNRELLLLNRVIAASADAAQDVAAFLGTICRELGQAFGVPQSMAMLLNEERTTATVLAESRAEGRLPALGQTIALAESPTLQGLLEYKAPQHLRAAQMGSDPELVAKLTRQQSTGSLLFLPIFVEGQMVGTLGLATTMGRSFSTREVGLAHRVAEQVSGVLARVRLIEAQQQLSTAVEQAAESIVITDAHGNILYVNPAFERISGYGHSEATGQNLLSLRRGKQDTAFLEHYRQTLAAGQVWQGRFVSKRKDGKAYTEEATIAPVRNPAGEIVSYIATMRDVTREIQLEEQFYQAQKMEAIGRLAGGIAHDFNNLLTVIHLSTRLLERGMVPEDPLWEHVKRIQESGARATQLVKQLLTFGRGEIIQPEMLNLNQVIADLSLMLQRIIGEDIKLRIELAHDLWSASADPSQMEQVIMNLAVNARDAMPRGGVLTIETSNVILDAAYAALHMGVQPGDYVMLTVSDTGTGMDAEVKSHLFEPFFTTKEQGKGTGLGLATVFGIIKQSRGQIQVHSEVGNGTTFRLYLPRAGSAKPESDSCPDPANAGQEEGVIQKKGSQDTHPAVVPESGPADPKRNGRQTILLVEDETAVRELAVQILESDGYLILAAKDGERALQISAQYDGPIHLLLTDVIMPRMSGRELAEMLRQQRPEMRVLYTSGYTHDTIVSHGVLGDGAVLLSKPLTFTGLTDAIHAALDEGG